MYCPVCENVFFSTLFTKNDFALIKCSTCGLVKVDNILEIFDVKNYDYYKNKTILSRQELYNPINRKRYISLLMRLEQYRKNNTLLDIGCGEGQFLSAAEELNWQAKGIELAPYAVEICQKFDIQAVCGNFLQTDFRNDYYDIITMLDVLEHLTQPREFLIKAYNLLRKGGALLFTTPNFNCLNRLLLQRNWRWIHKEHLFYFTPYTIKKLIKNINFKILEFKTKNIDLPELLSFFTRKSQDESRKSNQELRMKVERSISLLFLKEVVNGLLNIAQSGESIQCLCQKI